MSRVNAWAKAFESVFAFAIEQRLIYQTHCDRLRSLDASLSSCSDPEIVVRALKAYEKQRMFGLSDAALEACLRDYARGGDRSAS